jgi:hypothetical protein
MGLLDSLGIDPFASGKSASHWRDADLLTGAK